MTESNSLVRLIYASVKDRYVDGPELKNILNVAQTNNKKSGITGILLFNGGYFLQALEGSRAHVNKLYQSITKDQRHQNFQIIEFIDVATRTWGNWSMKLVSISQQEERIYEKYSGQIGFNPFVLNSDDAVYFLKEISNFDIGLSQ